MKKAVKEEKRVNRRNKKLMTRKKAVAAIKILAVINEDERNVRFSTISTSKVILKQCI